MSGQKKNKLRAKKRARTERILRAGIALLNEKRDIRRTRDVKKQQERRNNRD